MPLRPQPPVVSPEVAPLANVLQKQKPQKTIWEKIRDHPIFWTLALIATLLAVGEPVHQALVEPKISATGEPDVSSPFTVPFTVENRSWLFDMKGAQLHCLIDTITTTGHWAVMGFDIQSLPKTLEAETTGAYRCLIGPGATSTMAPPSDIISAHMFLFMSYDTLVFPRKSRRREFTWYTDANPHRWIEGPISK
jgi:hypothetical protein